MRLGCGGGRETCEVMAFGAAGKDVMERRNLENRFPLALKRKDLSPGVEPSLDEQAGFFDFPSASLRAARSIQVSVGILSNFGPVVCLLIAETLRVDMGDFGPLRKDTDDFWE